MLRLIKGPWHLEMAIGARHPCAPLTFLVDCIAVDRKSGRQEPLGVLESELTVADKIRVFSNPTGIFRHENMPTVRAGYLGLQRQRGAAGCGSGCGHLKQLKTEGAI